MIELYYKGEEEDGDFSQFLYNKFGPMNHIQSIIVEDLDTKDGTPSK